MRDKDTGWTEADITINGRALTFRESMALRVAVSSYRMFVRNPDNAKYIGERLAEGYNDALSFVEAKIMEKQR